MSTNALQAFHQTGGGMTANDIDAVLAAGQKNRPQVSHGNKPFLRLDQEGNGWMYGQENTPIEEGSLWAVNPASFRSGWVCWADPKKNKGKREKLGEVMASITNPPACPSLTEEQEAAGGQWDEQFGFDLICLSGEDEGEEVAFNTTSYSGKQAYDTIFSETAMRPSQEHCFPIVKLEFGSYRNQTWNKTIYTPNLIIVDWADMDQNLLGGTAIEQIEGTSEAVEDDQTDAAPEAEASEEAPTRRRRRRNAG